MAVLGWRKHPGGKRLVEGVVTHGSAVVMEAVQLKKHPGTFRIMRRRCAFVASLLAARGKDSYIDTGSEAEVMHVKKDRYRSEPTMLGTRRRTSTYLFCAGKNQSGPIIVSKIASRAKKINFKPGASIDAGVIKAKLSSPVT